MDGLEVAMALVRSEHLRCAVQLVLQSPSEVHVSEGDVVLPAGTNDDAFHLASAAHLNSASNTDAVITSSPITQP